MSPAPTGLTQDEAARRLREEGANDWPRDRRRGLLRILMDSGRDPMFQLLVAGVVVYLLIGDAGEAALLLVFVMVTIGIAVVQQQRTERVLESLREVASPRALLLRDGRPCRVAGREVVRGDMLVLSAGDRVAADARLHACQALVIDESLLTGESVPVRKRAGDSVEASPGGDDQPWVWAGTLVVGGQGLAEVTATGARSSLGHIGRSIAQARTPPTPLQQQTRRLVRLSAIAAAVLSLGLVVAFVARGDALAGSLLAGITLAMSLLPEEFTLILTVFMAMGAWRLSAARVLSRRPAAIEALGAATVLCADKTGTMTMNRMAVAQISAEDAGGIRTWCPDATPPRAGGMPRPELEAVEEPAPACARLLQTALLASPDVSSDPMERALQSLALDRLGSGSAPPGWVRLQAWGLQPDLLATTQAWQPTACGPCHIATKGAPEAVVALCAMTEERSGMWRCSAQEMAARGLRVIGVARAAVPVPGVWPSSPRGLPFEMLGLVGLADPLRPGVADAVRECQTAGIRVAMVTGDHATTALAIARQAGLPTEPGVLSGVEIDAMDDAQLAQRARQVSVFARVLPAHKLRLVQALQASGEVVAMTGDGVNDAPALKAAHIGIAMGGRGTDVARESAALVLLDDDFGAIVQGLRLGRRILDNVRKAMAFVLAVHVPIAGLSLLPLLTGGPPLLTPLHIAVLELLIDPACSIVFEAEAEEPALMRRPPRATDAPLISREVVVGALMQGALTLVAALAVYGLASALPWSDALQRASVFCTLVLGVLALILANRSLEAAWWVSMRQANAALWWAVAGCLGLLGAVLAVPAIGRLFGFAPITPVALAASVAAALLLLALLEAAEALARARRRRLANDPGAPGRAPGPADAPPPRP